MKDCISEVQAWIDFFAAIYLSAIKENDQEWLKSRMADEIKGVLLSHYEDKNRDTTSEFFKRCAK